MANRNNSMQLNHIGIIVTRPKGQSQNFINRLTKGGYTAFDLPGIIIVPARYQKSAMETLSTADQYDYLLFTSPNSVRFAKRLKLDFNKIKGFISIGSGTEKALKPMIKGRESITAPKPYTSEALVETLKAKGIAGKSILIVSGEGGRRLLDTAINDLGGKGEYCDVYRREAPMNVDIIPILAFKDEDKDKKSAGKSTPKAAQRRTHRNAGKNIEKELFLTISSQEAFTNLLPTLEQSGLKERIDGVIVGSDRLKNIVESEGFDNIIVARSALENDLWETIQQTFSNEPIETPSSLTTNNNDKERSMTQDQNNPESTAKETKSAEASAKNRDTANTHANPATQVTQKNNTEKKVADKADSKSSAKTNTDMNTEENSKAEDNAKTKSSSNGSKPNNNKANSAETKAEDVKVAKDAITENDKKAEKASSSNTTSSKMTESHSDDSSKEVPAKPHSQSLTYLALILAIGGLGLGGFSYFKGAVEQDKKINALSSSINADSTALTSLKDELSSLEKSLSDLKVTVDKVSQGDDQSLQGQVTLLAQKYETLNDAIADSAKGLQTQVDALKTAQDAFDAKGESIDNIAKVSNQAITIANNFDNKLAEQQLQQSVVLDEAKQLIATIKNTTDLETLRITEVDYLLKSALQKVQLDKDYQTAASLLTSALSRLSQINSVNFTETKNLLETNIDELKDLKPVSLVEVSDRLNKIMILLQNAPLKTDTALDNLKKEVFSHSGPEGETWTDRLTNSFKGLVVVENKRVEAPELMAKEDQFFLLQNIQLELTAAKVAVLQDQYTIFKQSIETVQTWVKTYFDEDNADVREAIQQIQWLLDANIDVTPPNIQRTLTDFEATLRAYKGAQQ